MPKKLIALDLDGTTLTNNKKISPRTVAAVEKVQELGYSVVIATGRTPKGSLQYHKELKLLTPMVNFNGGLIHHVGRPEKDVHFPMPREVALGILESCATVGAENVLVEMQNSFYVEKLDEFVSYLNEDHLPAGVGPIEPVLSQNPTCMLIRSSEQTAELLRTSINNQFSDQIVQRYWGAPYHVIEVMSSGVSKATGLQVLTREWGIEPKDVIVFGDQENDLEMFRWAGQSVAMGNAIDELKAVASAITQSNEEDGVAIYLEALFL